MADDGPLDPSTARPQDAERWLLALECATRDASVALLRGDTLVGERTSAGRGHHAEILLGLVDGVLSDAGVSLARVDGFAVSIGPGSFSSLRVGLASVKGLAFGSDTPIAPVSTLAALAWESARDEVGESGESGTDVGAALDARRGEVYAGVFRCTRSPRARVEVLCAEGVFSPQAFAELLPEPCRVVGSGADLYAPEMRAASGRKLDHRRAIAPNARAVGELAAGMLQRGEGVRASELTPRYLRRAEAEELRLARAQPPSGPDRL